MYYDLNDNQIDEPVIFPLMEHNDKVIYLFKLKLNDQEVDVYISHYNIIVCSISDKTQMKF